MSPVSVLVQIKNLQPDEPPLSADGAIISISSWRIDRTAYIGLPESLADGAIEPVERILREIGVENSPLRQGYRLDRDRIGKMPLPLDAPFTLTGDEPVPVVLLPSPSLLQALTRWSKENVWGEHIGADDPFEPLPDQRGRSVFFTPGWRSKAPIHTPPVPYQAGMMNGIFVHSPPHLDMGKIVFSSWNTDALLDPLHMGGIGGATREGELLTTPLTPQNPRLRRVRLAKPDQPDEDWIAYALVDGNGAKRSNSFVTPAGHSNFARPVSVPEGVNRKLGKHSLLRIPTPLDTTLTRNRAQAPHEDFALGEWAAGSDPPAFYMWTNAGSTPFRESFTLSNSMEGMKEGDQLWMIVVFDHITPDDLLKALEMTAVK